MDAFEESLRALPLLTELGRTRFADIFAGATRGSAIGELTVYLTRHDQVAEQAFRDLFAGVIDFQLAPRTADELERLHLVIAEQVDELAAAGIVLSSFGPHLQSGIEHIKVVDLTAEKADILRARFGEWIAVSGVARLSRAGRTAAGRGARPNRFDS